MKMIIIMRIFYMDINTNIMCIIVQCDLDIFETLSPNWLAT